MFRALSLLMLHVAIAYAATQDKLQIGQLHFLG